MSISNQINLPFSSSQPLPFLQEGPSLGSSAPMSSFSLRRFVAKSLGKGLPVEPPKSSNEGEEAFSPARLSSHFSTPPSAVQNRVPIEPPFPNASTDGQEREPSFTPSLSIARGGSRTPPSSLNTSVQLVHQIATSSLCSHEEIISLMKEMNAHFKSNSQEILANLETFSKHQDILSVSLDTMCASIKDSKQTAGQMESKLALAQKLNDLARTSSEQGLMLRKEANQLISEDFKGAIYLAFHVRKLELDYVHKQLAVLHTQDDHELQTFLHEHTEKLKKEVQQFDQCLRREKLKVAERENEAERKKALEAQQQQEEKDWRDLQCQREKIDRRYEAAIHNIHVGGHPITTEIRRNMAERLSKMF